MSRHAGRLVLLLLALGGLAVHIGLGYRFGLLLAGVGLLGTWCWRRVTPGATT